MPPRRPHRKSRTGCRECKKRHIKCDELRPVCGLCTTRGITCGFQSLESNQSGYPIPNGSTFSPIHENRRDQTLELRLLHHYSTETYLTISHKELELYYLQKVIPKFALSHRFVLECLFAVAALHLEYLEPSTSKDWLQIALDYQQRALTGFSRALLTVDSETCHAVALYSMYVALITIAMPGLSDETTLVDPALEVIGLRNLLQGASHIFTQWEASLKSGELWPYFQAMHDPELLVKASERISDGDMLPLHQSITHGLEKLHLLIDNSQEQEKTMYLDACQRLQSGASSVIMRQENSSIISWPLQLNPLILSALEKKEPLALLVFVHQGVVLHMITMKWFARDAGRRLVNSLLPSFGEIPSDWQGVLDWARKTVGIV